MDICIPNIYDTTNNELIKMREELKYLQQILKEKEYMVKHNKRLNEGWLSKLQQLKERINELEQSLGGAIHGCNIERQYSSTTIFN
jgi:hypothetical protein